MTTSDEDFAEFVRARTPPLLRAAYLLTGDQHLAEDLVQSALARTHRSWRRAAAGNPEAYVRKTMYHLQVDRWRRRRFTESALTAEITGDDDPGTAADARLDLRRALLRLGPRQRAVLVLRYFDDLTEAETARVLNCAVGTVKSQAAKGLARLRTLMAEPDNWEWSAR
jgi:RNA polymerase sigma-70 factor (sigma-E family)